MLSKFGPLARRGPFLLEVRLTARTAEPGAFAARVAAWCSWWVSENRYWQRRGRTLDYFDEFLGPPHDVTCQADTLLLALRCSEGARYWADWVTLRLARDLAASFDEVEPIVQVSVAPETGG